MFLIDDTCIQYVVVTFSTEEGTSHSHVVALSLPELANNKE